MNTPENHLSTEFTHSIDIDKSADAPRRIIESQESAYSYYAVASRFGGIKANDFLSLSRRFVGLSTDVYGESRATLSLNQGVPVGSDVLLASSGMYEGPEGQSVDMSQLNEESFKTLFDQAQTLTLDVRPREDKDPFKVSSGSIEWTRARANKLFFYAQDGHRLKETAPHLSLQNYLTRKMFYVPESATRGLLKVQLGIDAYLQAAEGRISRTAAQAAFALTEINSEE